VKGLALKGLALRGDKAYADFQDNCLTSELPKDYWGMALSGLGRLRKVEEIREATRLNPGTRGRWSPSVEGERQRIEGVRTTYSTS